MITCISTYLNGQIMLMCWYVLYDKLEQRRLKSRQQNYTKKFQKIGEAYRPYCFRHLLRPFVSTYPSIAYRKVALAWIIVVFR